MVFIDAALSSFREPVDLSDLAAGATGHVGARIAGLRAMRPSWEDM